MIGDFYMNDRFRLYNLNEMAIAYWRILSIGLETPDMYVIPLASRATVKCLANDW